MTVKLTWTPSAGATTQTVQYKMNGAPTWTTHSTVGPTVAVAYVTVLEGSYNFRIVNNCTECVCPSGGTLLPPSVTQLPYPVCQITETFPATLNTEVTYVTRTPYYLYGNLGTAVHSDLNPEGPFQLLDTNNLFWIRNNDPAFNNLTSSQKQTADLENGPVNRLAIWGVQGTPVNNYTLNTGASIPPKDVWIGFDICLTLLETKVYHVAIAADNGYRFSLNGQEILRDQRDIPFVFNYLHIYEVSIPAGTHLLRLEGINLGERAGFGCEVFDLSNRGSLSVIEFLNQQTNYDNLNVLFTTRTATQFTSNKYVCIPGSTENVSCTQPTCTQNRLTACTTVAVTPPQISAQNCPAPSVTTVTLTPGESTVPPLEECLAGLILEFIYLDQIEDIQLLPTGYTMPCPGSIGTHGCNRAFFEVFANGVYVGDALMNNEGNDPPGEGIGVGVPTRSGRNTCEDYFNVPNALRPNNVWTGSPWSRYSRIDISSAQAQAIANATNSGQLALSLVAAMNTYNFDCSGNNIGPHVEVTWFRISRPNGDVLYNNCPVSFAATIDICPQQGGND